jgi:hypothetical protein
VDGYGYVNDDDDGDDDDDEIVPDAKVSFFSVSWSPQMPGTFEFLSPELNMPLPFSSLIWWETATKFGLPAWTWRKHSTDLSFCLVCCVGKATCATSA